MRRRDFIAWAGAATASTVLPRAARAQQTAKVPRIAFLSLASPERVEALRAGLQDLGHVEGKNIAIELFIAPTTEETRAFAERAAASNPDVIVTGTTPATQFAKAWTSTIPIVMSGLNDPVGNGLVASLARPGGNVTGNTNTVVDLVGKQLTILKELVPTLRRLAVLVLPVDPSNALIAAQIRSAAPVVNVEPLFFDFVESQDFAGQIERIASANVQAFWSAGSNYFNAKNEALYFFQVRTRIPRFTNNTSTRPFYGVIGYGADQIALYRQAAWYVDAILKGTKPADLPVQQPTLFNLAVNLKTAREIGLTVPLSILTQATMVVE
jgi:putative ABC transport system substrate-binding protein